MAENKSKKWKGLKNKRLRLLILILCAVSGMALGVGIVEWGILNYLFLYYGGDDPVKDNDYSNIRNSLVGAIAGLFVFTALWVFRTMDTREQIDKTQEQIDFGF